jgi:hypothetical protein
MFKNGVLKAILGPKRKKTAGDCRELYKEKLHNLYSSPNIISDQMKEVEMDGACITLGRVETCIQMHKNVSKAR